jgi:multidrug resistance efflux pump
LANMNQAQVNLRRTVIRSPVNGLVANLLTQRGDYANVGQNVISVTDAGSFRVDGYFEETRLGRIHVGDPAEIKLMGYPQILRGHVGSIARAISVANAQPNGQGVATVNPIFTWVRLAQPIPVRIHIDSGPQRVCWWWNDGDRSDRSALKFPLRQVPRKTVIVAHSTAAHPSSATSWIEHQ